MNWTFVISGRKLQIVLYELVKYNYYRNRRKLLLVFETRSLAEVGEVKMGDQNEVENEVESEEVVSVEVTEEETPEVEEASAEEKVEVPVKKKAAKKAAKKVEPEAEVVAEVPAKKAPAKKASKKPEAKAVEEEKPAKAATKKVPAKKAAKKESAPRAKKDGLRAGQVRILKALVKKDLMGRVEIAQKAPVDVANCVELIGSHDEDKRAANDVKHYPSLITLGFVKPEQHDVEGKDTILYRITAKGKTEASKH